MRKLFAVWCLVLMTSVVMLCGCGEQKPTPAPVSDETHAVQLIGYFNGGPLPSGLNFTLLMMQQAPPAKLRAAWAQIQFQDGTFQNITHTRVETQGNFTSVYLTCLFANGTAIDAEVTFDQQHRVAGFHFVPVDLSSEYRPPSYANQSNFTESNVTVGTGTAWPLPATLSMPNGAGPFPAVVLVHGSGPNDRDETILADKPFKDLAWGLASRGIAVLRYEKRTKQYATLMASQLDNITVYEETVQDAQRAVALLRSTPGVNASLVFVLGHSLGAMLAPRIAANMTGIAGLILLAAPARPLEDLALNQTIYLAGLDGNITAAEQTQIAQMRQEVEKIHTLNISSGETVFYARRAYWVDLAHYDQVKTAQNLTLPMLFLQGTRDYQVNYTDDFLRWQAVLAGHPNVTFHAFDNLTHLFTPGSEPPSPNDYAVPGNVAVQVIDDIAAWIHYQQEHHSG